MKDLYYNEFFVVETQTKIIKYAHISNHTTIILKISFL